MAWDGSGTFSRTNGTNTGSALWGADRDAGDNILASRHDTHDQDLADGIAACLTKNNESKPTVSFKPNADNTIDLGSSALRWRRAFVGEVRDTSANEVLIFTATASAVNEITITNAATGNGPIISATGGDTDVSINLTPKGAGAIRLNGGSVVFTTTTTVIAASTSDAADSSVLVLQGGGGSDVLGNRGAKVVLFGNEHASTGILNLQSGAVAGATINFSPGGTALHFMNSAGAFFMNDNANAKAASGLTINQAGNDDEILSLKSSDVAHGVTVITETDSFGVFTKTAAASGGLTMSGLRSAGAHSLVLEGFAPTPETTPATTARCFVEVAGFMTSGTGKTDTTANGLVFGVRTRKGGADTTIAVFDEDGDFFLDGAAGAAFDSYNDARVIRAFERAVRDPATVIRNRWDELVDEHRDDFVRAGLVTAPKEGRGMWNISQNMRMLNGAAWQHECSILEVMQRLDDVERRLLN